MESKQILIDRLNGFLRDLSNNKVDFKPVRFNDALAVENDIASSDHKMTPSLDHQEPPSINDPATELSEPNFGG